MNGAGKQQEPEPDSDHEVSEQLIFFLVLILCELLLMWVGMGENSGGIYRNGLRGYGMWVVCHEFVKTGWETWCVMRMEYHLNATDWVRFQAVQSHMDLVRQFTLAGGWQTREKCADLLQICIWLVDRKIHRERLSTTVMCVCGEIVDLCFALLCLYLCVSYR